MIAVSAPEKYAATSSAGGKPDKIISASSTRSRTASLPRRGVGEASDFIG